MDSVAQKNRQKISKIEMEIRRLMHDLEETRKNGGDPKTERMLLELINLNQKEIQYYIQCTAQGRIGL